MDSDRCSNNASNAFVFPCWRPTLTNETRFVFAAYHRTRAHMPFTVLGGFDPYDLRAWLKAPRAHDIESFLHHRIQAPHKAPCVLIHVMEGKTHDVRHRHRRIVCRST